MVNFKFGDKYIKSDGTGTGANPFVLSVNLESSTRIDSRPYTYAIAEGDIANHSPFRRFGINPDVGTANEVIAPVGGTYYWAPAAGIMHVVSADGDDAAGDTGARTLWIQGLDAEYNVINETVTMNGASTVNTVKSYLRVLQTRVLSVGSSGANEGLISVKDATDTYTVNSIPALEGRSNYAVWTVPRGATAYLTSWHGSENSSKGTEISLWFREYGRSWEKLRMMVLLDDHFDNTLVVPIRFTEKTDIMMQAKGVLAGANVAGGFVGWWEVE